MNKKALSFVAICLVMCMIPSVGMLFFPTEKSTENKPMAESPEILTDDGKLNISVLQDCGDYFNDRIALRNQMIFADAKIQTGLFSESNINSVIYGKNGWLYYSSTLDDYLCRNTMSERELFNLAHNLSIVEDYLSNRDIDFVFTVPPNKNTLYGENMPYYCSDKVNSAHNAKRLKSYLEKEGVSYLDLFDLFEAQNETLYLMRDSHWNMKGACLAYNSVMDFLNKEHNDYKNTKPVIEKTANGDLNKMLYSFYGKTEDNYSYGLAQNYTYVNDVSGVDDGWIVTENKSGNGTLLMFRDSFADTLIPFISNEFKTAYYSKGLPNAFERYIEQDVPDCVVIEKVERNITDYLNTPPILTPPTGELPANITIANTNSDVTAEECLYDTNYFTVSGTVDSERITDTSEILVGVGDTLYRAYHTGENGFVLYLKKSDFAEDSLSVDVFAVDGENSARMLSASLALPK